MTTNMQAWKQPSFNENVTVHQIKLLLTENPGGFKYLTETWIIHKIVNQVAEPIVIIKFNQGDLIKIVINSDNASMSNNKFCAKQNRRKLKVSLANYNKLRVTQSLRQKMPLG